MENKEIEVRFLEIDKDRLLKKLTILKAEDQGESLLNEVIFYGSGMKWRNKLVRLRDNGKLTKITYKNYLSQTIDGTKEVEIIVNDMGNAKIFLEKIGLKASREQQKKRHTLRFNNVTVDIDTWPKIPTYVELEGESEDDLKEVAKKLEFDWHDAVFDDAASIIENRYFIPVLTMRYFTFDRFE